MGDALAFFALGFLVGVVLSSIVISWALRECAKLLNRDAAINDLRCELEDDAALRRAAMGEG